MYDNEFHRQADILANRNAELTAANKAIVALSDVLEKCAAYDSKLYYLLKEECEAVLVKYGHEIKRARGE